MTPCSPSRMWQVWQALAKNVSHVADGGLLVPSLPCYNGLTISLSVDVIEVLSWQN